MIMLPDKTLVNLTKNTEIVKIKVFAGKGTGKEIKIANHLETQYNVSAFEWKKVRGNGYVDVGKKSLHAELHWFESDETGPVLMKVKRWFDE